MHQIFILLLLLHSSCSAQRTDPLSTEDQVCITSSQLSLNGIYRYRLFDTKARGPMYHNLEQGYYLYPWKYSDTDIDYLISQHPTQNTATSYCNLPPNDQSIINPDDCFNSWLSNTHINPHIILVNCNDICIHGSSHTFLQGTYKWIHFNSTTNSSVYFCQECDPTAYLFGYVYFDITGTHHNWRIGPRYPEPAAWSSCFIDTNDTNYVFDLKDCIGWDDAINQEWIDRDIIAQKCITNQDNAPVVSVTLVPTINPSVNPIIAPTISTHNPSVNPSLYPTVFPSSNPSVFPTIKPTQNPTIVPTLNPSVFPTIKPTQIPTIVPTKSPTLNPSVSPTFKPTSSPIIGTMAPSTSTNNPTLTPSLNPSQYPSINPSIQPTKYPTIYPSINPTIKPTYNPSKYPITSPTRIPSTPSYGPTHNPSNTPSNIPNINTVHPSLHPTIYPTHETMETGVEPSVEPTDIMTTHIIISTHPDINDEWIAFSLSNMDLTCGGYIEFVGISDSDINNKEWMTTSSTNDHGWYEFSGFDRAWILPISVQITKHDHDNHHKLQSIIGENIIDSWTGGMMYDFGDNFCAFSSSDGDKPKHMSTDSIDNAFYYLVIAICFVFIMFGIVSIVEAKCCHKNDYFEVLRVISAVISILTMMSFFFFINEVWLHLYFQQDLQVIFVVIFTLSIIFLIVPMLISIYILYYESSSKYWLFNDRIRDWMLKYTELLYFYSVITGSSFTAMDIFNSNLFGLDLFYMGIPHQKLLPFIVKKVYSMILFSNFPQFTLSLLHCALLSKLHFIPFVSMIFSSLSIIITIINIIIQKEIIYKTNDYLDITLEVQGKSEPKLQHYCKNKIKNIKAYLCQSVFGINDKFVQIMRPYVHDTISKGLQLQIHITYEHNTNSKDDPSDKYEDLLNNAIDHGALRQVIKNEWKLVSVPKIKNISCHFVKSIVSSNKLRREQIQTDDDYSDDGSQSHETIMDRWVQCTEIEDRNESESVKPVT